MSFLEALRDAPKTPQAKLNTFLAEFRPDFPRISAFVEGRDDPSFYRPHLASFAEHVDHDVRVYQLGRKRDVLGARDFISRRYGDHPRILYFVDKDHDDIVPGAPAGATESTLFVTSYYSIESYCACREAVRIVLLDLWGLDSSNPAIQTAEDQFEAALHDLHAEVKPWMAWIVAMRRRGLKPSNDNVQLRSLLAIGTDLVVILEWPEEMPSYLARKCGIELQANRSEIDAVSEELAEMAPKTWIRGKIETDFLVMFLERLEEQAKASGEVRKVRTKIGLTNAVEIIGPRLSCPDDLRSFLERAVTRIADGSVKN